MPKQHAAPSARQLTLRIERYGDAYFATLRYEHQTWPVVSEDGSRTFLTTTDAFRRGLIVARSLGSVVGPVEWPEPTSREDGSPFRGAAFALPAGLVLWAALAFLLDWWPFND